MKSSKTFVTSTSVELNVFARALSSSTSSSQLRLGGHHFLIIEHPCLVFFASNHLSTLGNLCGRFSAQFLFFIVVIVVSNLEERTAGRHEEDSIVVDVCKFIKMTLIR